MRKFIGAPFKFVASVFAQLASGDIGNEGCVCHSRANGHNPDTSSVEVVWRLKQSHSNFERASLMAIFSHVTAKTFLN
jgi:hypothetical protein